MKYYEKSLIDRTIGQVLSQDKQLCAEDLNKVGIAAQIQEGIEKYRNKAKTMSRGELRSEKHSSVLLGKHLEMNGKKRPQRCHAHAIVAQGKIILPVTR